MSMTVFRGPTVTQSIPSVRSTGRSWPASAGWAGGPVSTATSQDVLALRFAGTDAQKVPAPQPWTPIECPSIRHAPLYAKGSARRALNLVNILFPIVAFESLDPKTDAALRRTFNMAIEALRMACDTRFPDRLVELVLPPDALKGANLTNLGLDYLYMHAPGGEPVSLDGATLSHTNFSFSRLTMDFQGTRLQDRPDAHINRLLKTHVLPEFRKRIQGVDLPDLNGLEGDLRPMAQLAMGENLMNATEFYRAILDRSDLSGLDGLKAGALEHIYYRSDNQLPASFHGFGGAFYEMHRLGVTRRGELNLDSVPRIPLEATRRKVKSRMTALQEEGIPNIPERDARAVQWKQQLLQALAE